MKCPKCGYKQICPCTACRSHRGKQEAIKPWIEKGAFISCANCKHTMEAMDWLDLEMNQYKKVKQGIGA
jgi:hypothetical protein